MACTLAACPTAEADYQGTINATFEVSVSSSSGTATLNFARYNGINLTSSPWKFTVASGVNLLTLVIESTVVGDRISVNEVTDGCNQTLDGFAFSPSGAPEGLEIKGI